MTVTDANGNSAACTATVTVEDITPPIAICKNRSVEIQPNGTYDLLESDVFDDINSSDACGIFNVDFPATTYSCAEAGMNFTIPVSVSDESGNTAICNANIQVEIGEALPDNWTATDIGNITIGNSHTFDPCADNLNGEYTITGSGNNTMGATSDHVAFSSQTICGDGMITAKVENVTPNGYGGLMIRETTDADAKQVAVFSNLSNALRHETRYTTGGFKQVNNFFKPSPIWLRLERQGDWIFAYYSSTGANFQYIHGVHVPMQSCVEIGLASFTYLPNAQTEAFFTNVNVSGTNGSMSTGIDASPVKPELFNLPLSNEKLKLEVYPNPANHEINLVFERPVQATTTITLLNQLGQAVEQRQLQAGNQSCNWDISLLPAGA